MQSTRRVEAGWQTISLSCLTCGASPAGLFSKTNPAAAGHLSAYSRRAPSTLATCDESPMNLGAWGIGKGYSSGPGGSGIRWLLSFYTASGPPGFGSFAAPNGLVSETPAEPCTR